MRPGWLTACMTVLTLWCIAQPMASVWAQTPYSQGRFCGAPGQPACPPPPVIISPRLYEAQQPFVPVPSQWFSNIADVVSWYQGEVLTSWCTATYTGSTPVGTPSYTSGIETQYSQILSFADTEGTGCTYDMNSGEQVLAVRSNYCPSGYTLYYQSSPALGPFCGGGLASPLPPPPPLHLKQQGDFCPGGCGAGTSSSNSGGADAGTGQIGKADPVNVSNGNKYQKEIDYVGVGTNPLKFVRTYNSLVGASLSSYTPPAQATLLGTSWSATYFQFLLPASVTDSNGTHNGVTAYRPDGRVLMFTQYNTVYTPDADVADRLVQTSNGWEYQTADDTIETYDSSGDLPPTQ